MSPITTHRSWSDTDQLDGVDLIDGEALMLRWPDGHTARAKIRVEKRERTYLDHGHEYPVLDSFAYVDVSVHGATGRIYLNKHRQFRAERVESRTKKAGAKPKG